MNLPIKYVKRFSLLLSQLFLFSWCFLHFNAQADDSFPKPSKGEGLLLMDLDIKAPSAVMSLHKIGRLSSPIEIKLIANHGRWLVKSLPAGDYQITDIKVPYFDLPFRKDTGESPAWRIRIQTSYTNYAGRIEIEKERTKDYIAIYKRNRMITDLSNIQKDLASLLLTYPLTNGNGMRDDFIASTIDTGAAHD